MRKYKERLLALLAVSTLLALVGCSKPILDWRNAQVSNGLIYAGDANTPFSGTVTGVPSQFLFTNGGFGLRSQGLAKLLGEAGSGVQQDVFFKLYDKFDNINCTASVRKGYVNGKATCQLTKSGEEFVRANFSDGVLNGKFTYFNPDRPDQKMVEGNLSNDQPDGAEQVYSVATGKLILKTNWSTGKYDGDVTVFDASSGKVTLEGSWKDGKQDGTWKQYSQDGKHLTSNTHYKNGLREGVAEYFDPDTGSRVGLDDKWINGNLNGERKIWDKNGALLKDEIYDNGNLVKSKDVGNGSGNQLVQALSGNVPAAAPAPSQADATTSAASTSSSAASLQACVQGWTDAHHAEAAKAGVDDAVSMDQLNEWREWCKDGKQAPKA